MREFIELTKDFVDGYTYHEYIGVNSTESALDPDVLDASFSNGLKVAQAVYVCLRLNNSKLYVYAYRSFSFL